MTIRLALDNQVALITGGSRGIGAATVRLFVAAGAKVVFSYEKSTLAAEGLVRELGTDRCAAIQASLNGIDSAERLVGETVRKFGGLDILVANHGVWEAKDVAVNEMTTSQWRRTLGINLDSVFALVKYSVGEMKKGSSRSTPKHIVIISSTAGQRGEAFHCDYAATKGAVISMVKGLSTELASDGIYVNCVAPGWVETDMSAPALRDSETSGKIMEKIPLGRVAKPEEIAAPILFLCTPHAGFITGEILNVNGGAVLVG